MTTVGNGPLYRHWGDTSDAVAELDPDDVFTALLAVQHNPGPHVSLSVVHDDGIDPLIVVTEDDRTLSLRFDALIETLHHTRVTTAGIEDGLRAWADTRPVSNAAATTKGIAVLGRYGHEPRWQVVVPRATGVAPAWVPTLHDTPAIIADIRRSALRRAQYLTVTPLASGRVTMWTYLPCPALSSAVLTQPEALTANTPIEHLCVVFAPGRSVAVADQTAATRMVSEVSHPFTVIPADALDNFGWM